MFASKGKKGLINVANFDSQTFGGWHFYTVCKTIFLCLYLLPYLEDLSFGTRTLLSYHFFLHIAMQILERVSLPWPWICGKLTHFTWQVAN